MKYCIFILSLIFGFKLYGQELKTNEDYAKALKQLKVARETKNTSQLADLYYNIGVYEEEHNKNSEIALDYFIRAKQYYDRDKNIENANKINRLIAKRYAKSGFKNESRKIYEDLITYYQEQKDDQTLAYIYLELSHVYRDIGDSEKALSNLSKSIQLSKVLKDSLLFLTINFDRIDNYIRINDADSSLIVAAQNIEIASKLKHNDHLSKSLYYIALVNLKQKKFDRAVKYFQTALSLSSESPYDENRRFIYDGLSKSFKGVGNFKEAYNFASKFNSLNDSILNNDRVKAINDLSIKHQADQKEKDIRLLEIENKSVLQKIFLTRSALYFVGAGFFALLVGVYFIVRFYTQRIRVEKIINDQQHEIDVQKIRELEDKIKISNMQSMIVGQEKERERIAGDLHDSLGGLLSAVKLQFDKVKRNLNGHLHLSDYTKATNLLDIAVEEVRNISRNLQPGALKDMGLIVAIKDLVNRFEGGNYPKIFFQYFNFEEKLDEMTTLNIYRIVQELINNTIKHAHAKEILIQMIKEGDEIIIEYEDDGKGFDPTAKKAKRTMGIENINSRVNFLKGHISINSKENEGVSYLISIPIPKQQELDA